MGRQGQLHDEAVHLVVVVQPVYAGQQFGFGHILFVAYECRFETAGFAGQHLVAYVGLAASIVSHEYRSQMRTFASGSDDAFHFFGYFLLDGGRRGLSVYQLHGQLFRGYG